jgi:hypothetical protein
MPRDRSVGEHQVDCDGRASHAIRPRVRLSLIETICGQREKTELLFCCSQFLTTTEVNICGRQYILRAEIARFNQRAAAGEFAKSPNPPRKRLLRVVNTACELK